MQEVFLETRLVVVILILCILLVMSHLVRLQPRALDYFERSIAAPGQPPNPSAMCGAASMYIKGEGIL